jgi:glycosyltransferase involved in cell wall biosynthesis
VGRFAPEKNIAHLLRAFGSYRKSGGNRHLVLVGNGPEFEQQRRFSSELGLNGSILFAGKKDYNEILPFYAFADWLILPSLREPWGLVANEAMASGLPIIASPRCGCFDDLVQEGVNGLSFDPDSTQAAADALLRADSIDESARREMAEQSRRMISAFSLERWRQNVEELLTCCRETDSRLRRPAGSTC